jgi:hypothetical protein
MPFRAPQPPLHAVMPHTTQQVLLVLMSVIAVASTAALLRDCRRQRSLLGIYCLIGAALGILYEPLGDELVMAFYPAVHQHTWISAFGRHIPTFIGILYFWYMAPFVVIFTRYAGRGFTTRQWWALWGGTLAFCAGFEMFWMAMKQPWLYYGHQALVVARLPIWVPFTYVSFLFAMSAGVYGIVTKLPRRHMWLVIPGMPCLLAAGHAATSIPGAAALYSTHNHALILLGALGSMALATMLSFALSLCFRRPAEPLTVPDEALHASLREPAVPAVPAAV